MHAANIGDALAVALFIAIPLLALHSAISLILRARSVRNWKPVDGYVDYVHDYTIKGGGSYGQGTIGTGIEIEYRYSFGAAEFKGSNVSIADLPPRLWATQYRELMPALKTACNEKKSIAVFVNPAKPQQAVLSMPPVTSQLHSCVFALLAASILIPSLFLQEMSAATWVGGVGLGLLIYLLFLAGVLSTAF